MPDDETPTEHLYANEPASAAALHAVLALQELSRSAQEAEELALATLGVGPLDARALLHIVHQARNDRLVRPKDLVRLLHVSSAAITKLVDRLVRSGRIERQPDPRDRRGLVLAPSAEMADTLLAVYGRIHGPLVAVVDRMSSEELEVVARFSSELSAALDAETRRKTGEAATD